MTRSITFPRNGDKQNPPFFEEYLLRLQDLHGVVECQQGREFRFFSQGEARKLELQAQSRQQHDKPRHRLS